jgi:hypothetical protein
MPVGHQASPGVPLNINPHNPAPRLKGTSQGDILSSVEFG